MKKWDRRRIKPQPKFHLRRWERWVAATFMEHFDPAVIHRGDIQRFLGRFSEEPLCLVEPLMKAESDR